MGLYVTDWERRDLRRQRLMLGVSQRDMDRLLRKSYSSYAHRERGEIRMTRNEFDTCREYLGELAKSRREAVRS